jgi:hypothetical protein
MTKTSSMHQPACKIKTWRQFAKNVRPRGCRLLKCLDDYPDSILVSGCQRSGTTILSRVITHSDAMVNYWFGRDDELDAALILSGEVGKMPKGRYCFQTTYLNECYREYFDHHGGFRLIWVLRNPFSVIYSLMYNWRRWTLNELFDNCGAHLLDAAMAQRYRRFGSIAVPRILKACLAYNGKVSQLSDLMDNLGKNSIMAVEYDEMVIDRETQLKKIFSFVDLPYKKCYGEMIHQKSTKKKNLLSEKEQSIVRGLCTPIYENALQHLA